eukprot:PLAT12567.1.p4 GENE.PLAT12567.1~~PLAT12567.1.p4  ORF type:complete len:120 (+),score=40.50 PLAT12567.1:410-769(+)
MSAIWYHDEAQQEAASLSMAEQNKAAGGRLVTLLKPAKTFYLAEDYHQKYQLRQKRRAFSPFSYMTLEEMMDSEAAVRTHALVSGNLRRVDYLAMLPGFEELDEDNRAYLARLVDMRRY